MANQNWQEINMYVYYNNNDHCSGLLRSGEGGSDKLVEHRLPNLPVQKLCTHRKKEKNVHPGTQTNQQQSDDYE